MKNILVFLFITFLLSCNHGANYDLSILNVKRIDIETGQIDNVDIYINQDRVAFIQSANLKDLAAKKLFMLRVPLLFQAYGTITFTLGGGNHS
jgi:hypothetical protein